ncbi:MAG: hypothetical protein JO146_00980 [Candidatus Eremiobacteraeota bacterium]|nr:hypothetical protein [Candidatus Eremiobacteraeota bacterium]
MMKSFVAFLSLAMLLLPVSAGAQTENNVNATGNWSVNSTGEPLANGTFRLRQDGPNLTGTYGGGGKIEGKFASNGLQVDATWSDARGNGWMTIVFGSDGNRFSGDWGRPGSRPSGHFEGSRAAYPAVTGTYHTTVGGSDAFSARHITLRQLGLDVVGNFGPGTQLNGTMSSANTFDGTWKGPNSNGWMKLQFADDSRSFQGTWGLTPGSEPAGTVSGSVRNAPANVSTATNTTAGELDIRGLWHIASSGGAFAGDTLKLEQQGRSVSGSYKNGHLEGTISSSSHSLSGNWRDARGTGVFTISFASDGMSFHGTWTTKYNSGSLIGKRVIAATPALRQ